jgi:ribonucleoside-diphosphate reductase alpha chain
MRGLIDMAAERAPFIDHGQSLNLFVESPTIGILSSMYFHAWKRGLKTTYYLRSRPATEIAKTSAASSSPSSSARPNPPAAARDATTDEPSVRCALESPGTCEACQ